MPTIVEYHGFGSGLYIADKWYKDGTLAIRMGHAAHEEEALTVEQLTMFRDCLTTQLEEREGYEPMNQDDYCLEQLREENRRLVKELNMERNVAKKLIAGSESRLQEEVHKIYAFKRRLEEFLEEADI